MILHSIAMEPSLVADKDEREPRKPPIGVRATPTMHTSVPNLGLQLNQTKKLSKAQNLNFLLSFFFFCPFLFKVNIYQIMLQLVHKYVSKIALAIV